MLLLWLYLLPQYLLWLYLLSLYLLPLYLLPLYLLSQYLLSLYLLPLYLLTRAQSVQAEDGEGCGRGGELGAEVVQKLLIQLAICNQSHSYTQAGYLDI